MWRGAGEVSGLGGRRFSETWRVGEVVECRRENGDEGNMQEEGARDVERMQRGEGRGEGRSGGNGG